MKSLRQTADSLTIDTPELTVRLPGAWQVEDKLPSEHAVFCGYSSHEHVHKRFIVSVYWLAYMQLAVDSKQAFEELLKIRLTSEEQVTRGAAKIIAEPFSECEGLLLGGYFASHPSAARVVFSRAISDREKAVICYYELWGFTDKPDVRALFDDFEEIMATVVLK